MTWLQRAKPGDLVICIDDSLHPEWLPKTQLPIRWTPEMGGLKKGQVYTIRAIGPDNVSDLILVWLVEIVRRTTILGEAGFVPQRFKPVDPAATDLFRRLAAPVPRINAKDLIA